LNWRLMALHIAVLTSFAVLSTIYDIMCLVYVSDHYVASHDVQVFLAVLQLTSNIANVSTFLLLGYMMDKMTDIETEDFIEPILKKQVPLFVHLASYKLLNNHLNHEDEAEDSGVSMHESMRVTALRSTTSTINRRGLRIERELKRVIDAYSQLVKDPRWNELALRIALKFVRF